MKFIGINYRFFRNIILNMLIFLKIYKINELIQSIDAI